MQTGHFRGDRAAPAAGRTHNVSDLEYIMICPLGNTDCPHKEKFKLSGGNIHCAIHKRAENCNSLCCEKYLGTQCRLATTEDVVLYRLAGGKI
jgi:hypothetical protein